uniref:JmjC domain-containing protein n=1 Tax=Alexandrium monilatum TaxID=311494 RepID=A0A7S4UGZ8_9DINO
MARARRPHTADARLCKAPCGMRFGTCVGSRPSRLCHALLCLPAVLLRGLASALEAATLNNIRKLVSEGAGARCDLPRLDALGLRWSDLKQRGLRESLGVILTGLFSSQELSRWHPQHVLPKHGNESMNADNTRGAYSLPRLQDYVAQQDPERMIFVSHSLLGLFGEAFRFATKPPRLALLRDFAERPILSIGVKGSSVPSHPEHPETWQALLHGMKAWWLGPAGVSFAAFEDPCSFLGLGGAALPDGVHFCVQRAGEILYFAEGVQHSVCSLDRFVLGVGAQGHTEEWPAMVRAANRGDLPAAKRLMGRAAGADANRALDAGAGAYGHTALHRAALHGHTQLVKYLLASRAQPDLPDGEGMLPIFLAAFSGHVEVLEHLADFGAGVRARDPNGASILQWASTQGHLEVVKTLVSKLRADVRAQDSLGGGSMSAAATVGHRDIVQYLRDQGAEVGEANADGMRPIHWASLHGHAEMVEWLLAARAAALPRDKKGRTPLDLANEHRFSGVAQLLRAAGGGGARQRRRQRRRKTGGSEL